VSIKLCSHIRNGTDCFRYVDWNATGSDGHRVMCTVEEYLMESQWREPVLPIDCLPLHPTTEDTYSRLDPSTSRPPLKNSVTRRRNNPSKIGRLDPGLARLEWV
jgi:hypothetical protein